MFDKRNNSGSVEAIGVVLAGIVVISLIVAGLSWAPVNEGNVKVVTDQGRAERALQPGWHLVNPVTENTHSIETRPREYTMSKTQGEGEKSEDDSVRVLTNDGVKVDVDVTVRYRVNKSDSVNFYSQYRTVGQAEARLLRPTIRSVLRTEGGDIETSRIYTGSGQDQMRDSVHAALVDEADDNGLVIEAVQIRNIHLPDSYEKAVERKEIKKQEVQQKEYEIQKEQAEKKRRIVAAEADAEERIIQANAEANATLRKAQAEAKANELVADSVSPQLNQYIFYKNLDKTDSTFFFGDSGNSGPLLTKELQKDD